MVNQDKVTQIASQLAESYWELDDESGIFFDKNGDFVLSRSGDSKQSSINWTLYAKGERRILASGSFVSKSETTSAVDEHGKTVDERATNV